MTNRSMRRFDGLCVATAVALAATGGVFLGRSTPADVLARSYGPALESVAAEWHGPASPDPRNIWLSRSEPDTVRPLRKALSIGERISIGLDRGEQVEITEVETIESDMLGGTGSLIQIVTGRPENGGGLVRFIFAVEPAPAPTSAPKPEKLL